jgi:two-component system LytT family response regulator
MTCDGISALQAIDQLQPEVAFLDIQMPGLNGLEIAAQLEAATAPLLVFVTAFDEHAVKAFDLNAIDYLLKPYDKERLAKSLARIRERVGNGASRGSAVKVARAQTGCGDRLLVPVGEQLQLIEVQSIEWLEADDNYVRVHSRTRQYLLRRSLADLLMQLGEHRFVRIHKSAAVNLSEIQSLAPLFKGDFEVHLRGGHKLRLSRRYKDALFTRMGR